MKQNVPDNNERWTLPTHHRDLGTTQTRLISDIPYPTQQIILKYISLGGMLGGFIIYTGMAILEASVTASANIFGIFIIISGFVGLIPALITSLVIIKLKIYRIHRADDIKVFLIGAVVSTILFVMVSFLSYAIFSIDNSPISNLYWFAYTALYASIIGAAGGLSSLIIGYSVIPKIKV